MLTAAQKAAYKHDLRCDLVLGLVDYPSTGRRQTRDRIGPRAKAADGAAAGGIHREQREANPKQEGAVARRSHSAAARAACGPIHRCRRCSAFRLRSAGCRRLNERRLYSCIAAAAALRLCFCVQGRGIGRRLFTTGNSGRPQGACFDRRSGGEIAAIQTKSQAAALGLFDRYEPKAAATKPSPDKQKSQQAEYQRALEKLGKEVVGQIEAVLQPRQIAALTAIVRKDKETDKLLRQDRAVLDDLHATARQRAKLQQIFTEFTAPDYSLQRPRGAKVLPILTSDQRKKLDEAVEQYGL